MARPSTYRFGKPDRQKSKWHGWNDSDERLNAGL
jgi:hypothetical protein